MIVATAGHIDHGKTTLVRALTGIDTDRLPQEKARGISIEPGFAHMCLPTGETLGFVDVPGHERFVRNMLSGVYAVDHVLLVVAADDGVMPQTREHLAILTLLGVRDGTVVVTKCDRVSAERVAAVAAEAGALLCGGPLSQAEVIAASAHTGKGLDSLRARLQAAHAAAPARRGPVGLLARFVVDRVFTMRGSGTVVTGTVLAGEIAPGDSLVISPSGVAARVRGLQRHGAGAARVQAGERCAINIGVDRERVARGDWLVAPAAHEPTERIDVRLVVLPGEPMPLEHWTPVHLHIGAADVAARVALRRGAAVMPGQAAFAQLRLERPIHAAWGDRLILRDQAAQRTVGGGVVLDPVPPARRSAARMTEVLGALENASPPDRLRSLLQCSPCGVSLVWLERVHAWPPGRADALLPEDAQVVQTPARLAFGADQVAAIRARVVAQLQAFHQAEPAAPGLELAVLGRKVATDIPQDAFPLLVRSIGAGAGVELRGSQARLATHGTVDSPRDALAWQRVQPALHDAGTSVPSVRELAVLTKVPLQALRDLLHRKAAAGALVKITPERFALPATLDILARLARETADRQPGGVFTAAQFRDAIGSGRGLAIELLECLDRHGVTRRQGDNGRIHLGVGGDAHGSIAGKHQHSAMDMLPTDK